MKTHSKLSSSILALLGSIAISHAETVTWDGVNSGDATWTDADSNSWSGGQYDNGDDAQFLGAGAGTVTLSGTIDPGSVTVNSANDYTFSGSAITGTGSLTKDGVGTLTLTAQNLHEGVTTVSGGTLVLEGGAKTLDQFATLTITGASSLVQLGPTVGANNIIDNMVVNIQNGATLDDTTNGNYVHSMQTTTFTNGGTLSSTGTGYNGTFGNYLFNGDITVSGNAAATIDADAITLNGTGRLITVDDVTADANADLTISSIIKAWGTGGHQLSTVNKNGTGTLVLSGANTYTGATNVNGGVLELNENDSNYSGGAISINNGATLRIDNQTGTYNISNKSINFDSNGSGTYEIVGGHNHIWSGSNTVTTNGGSENTISGSSINTNSGGAAGTTTFNVADGTDASDLTVSSVIYNEGGVLKTGAGTLRFSSDMTYTGGTTVNGGELQLDSGGGTLQSGTTLTIDGASSVVRLGPTAFGNNIFGSGALFIQNGGTMIDDTPGGAVHSINNGLTFTNGGSLTSTGVGNGTFGNYYFGGGSGINVTGNAAATISADSISITNGRTITVADVTGDANADLTVSSVIRNSNIATVVNKYGDGTLALTTQNTHTGGTTVFDGTLDLVGQNILTGNGGLGNGSALTVDGSNSLVKLSATGINAMNTIGPLTLKNGGTFTDNGPVGGLHSVYAPVVFDGGGTMTSEVAGNGGFGNFLFINGIQVTSTTGLATIDAHSVSFNFSQTLDVADSVAGSGTDLLISSSIRNERVGTITKNGLGKLTLTGANVDTSAWAINDGTLEVQNGSALEDTAVVTVNAAGTLEVDNNETIGRLGGAGNVTLNANLTTGDTVDSEISGNISGSGALIKQGASTLTLSGDNSGFSGGITVQNDNSRLALNSANAAGTGDLTFSGGTHLKFFNGATGPTTINNNLNTGAGSWFYWEAGSKALEITGDWSNSSAVVWLNSANTLTMSGVVSGTWSTWMGGGGTIALTNSTNTYTGNHNATLNSTIQFNTIADSGVNSSLGAGTTIVFDGGNQSFNGYIENIGAGGSTNRAITIGETGSAKEAGIANNGTGALNFSGTFTNDAAGGGTRTLLLGGNYAGENTISSLLSDGTGGGKIALTKDGSTTWVLTGANTYTGGTTVNDGTLQIGDGSNSTASVAGTTTLSGGDLAYDLSANNFGVNGAITLTDTATITKLNGAVQQNFSSGTLNGGGQILNIDVDTTDGTKPLYFNQTAGTALGQVNILNGAVGQDGAGLAVAGRRDECCQRSTIPDF